MGELSELDGEAKTEGLKMNFSRPLLLISTARRILAKFEGLRCACFCGFLYCSRSKCVPSTEHFF